MFPVRGLLSHVPCPDQQSASATCKRSSCPFHHEQAKARETVQSTPAQEQEVEDKEPSVPLCRSSASADAQKETSIHQANSLPQKRRREAQSTPESQNSSSRPEIQKTQVRATNYTSPLDRFASATAAPAHRNAYAAAKASNGVTSTSSDTGTLRTSKGAEQEKGERSKESPRSPLPTPLPSTSTPSSSILSVPIISRAQHSTTSQVPLAIRQSSLRTYFSTFSSLYAPLHPSRTESASSSKTEDLLKRVVHRLASEDALASEQTIYRSSNTKVMTYRNSVRTTLVGITRRQKEDRQAQEQGHLDQTIGSIGMRAEQRARELTERGTSDEDVVSDVIALLRKSEPIGTMDDVIRKKREVEEREKGRLDKANLEKAGLVAALDLLERVEYPIPRRNVAGKEADNASNSLEISNAAIEETWGAGGSRHDLIGDKRTCERCKTDFTVQALKDGDDGLVACNYHWGKKRYVREGGSMRGPRLPRWSCCDALDEATTFASASLSQIAVSSGIVASGDGKAFAESSAGGKTSGCARGPHVFKEEDTASLHEREAFAASADLCREASSRNPAYEVLALDCELICTTAGLSLARLTVLDQAGEKVLDRYVRPRAAIVDLNTRFSGIQTIDSLPARDCQHSLEGARHALACLMTPETVLVGHGLENDLKALRLVHTRVADSALLYPHPKGLPFRMSLRELTEKHLGRYIQLQSDSSGHDAEEDARAALDLVRLQYRAAVDQGGTGIPKPYGDAKGDSIRPERQNSSQAASSVSSGSDARTPQSPLRPVRMLPPTPSAKATASLFMPKRRGQN